MCCSTTQVHNCSAVNVQQVGSLRAGRFFAVRLRAYAYAELDTGPVFFDDTYTSELLPFRTLPCIPGQMQAPSLARRDRNLLKVRLAAAGGAPGATAGAAGGCPYHQNFFPGVEQPWHVSPDWGHDHSCSML